jgi:hypothetical protein
MQLDTRTLPTTHHSQPSGSSTAKSRRRLFCDCQRSGSQRRARRRSRKERDSTVVLDRERCLHSRTRSRALTAGRPQPTTNRGGESNGSRGRTPHQSPTRSSTGRRHGRPVTAISRPALLRFDLGRRRQSAPAECWIRSNGEAWRGSNRTSRGCSSAAKATASGRAPLLLVRVAISV